MVQHQSWSVIKDCHNHKHYPGCGHNPKQIYGCGWWCTEVKRWNRSLPILMKNWKGTVILLWRPMASPSNFKVLCDCVLCMNFLIVISCGLVLAIQSLSVLPILARRPVRYVSRLIQTNLFLLCVMLFYFSTIMFFVELVEGMSRSPEKGEQKKYNDLHNPGNNDI